MLAEVRSLRTRLRRASSTRSTTPNVWPCPRAPTTRSPTPRTTSPSTSSSIREYEQLLGTGNFEGQNSETGSPAHGARVADLPLVGLAGSRRPGFAGRLLGLGLRPLPAAAGEHTEIHPFRVLWVERNPGGPSPRSAQGDREADLFVTTTETPADRHAVCALDHKADRPGFQTCVTHDVFGKKLPVARGDFRPEGCAKAVTLGASRLPRRRSRQRRTGFDPQGRGRRRGLVRTRGGGHDRERSLRRLAPGQSPAGPPSRPPRASCSSGARWTRVARSTTRSVRSGTSRYCSIRPGRSLRASGTCTWTPRASGSRGIRILLQAHDGETFRTKQTIDLYVAKGKPWRLFVQTRECDFGSVGNAYSVQGVVAPCPHVLELGNGVSDDRPGIIAIHFRSPTASIGTHRVNSSLEGSTCPASNTKGCYRLTFTISRIRP